MEEQLLGGSEVEEEEDEWVEDEWVEDGEVEAEEWNQKGDEDDHPSGTF